MKSFMLGLAVFFLVSCSHAPPAPGEKPSVVLSGQEHEDFCERIEALEKPNHGFSFEKIDISGDRRISRQEFFCASHSAWVSIYNNVGRISDSGCNLADHGRWWSGYFGSPFRVRYEA